MDECRNGDDEHDDEPRHDDPSDSVSMGERV
jgi:hypothetical protein